MLTKIERRAAGPSSVWLLGYSQIQNSIPLLLCIYLMHFYLKHVFFLSFVPSQTQKYSDFQSHQPKFLKKKHLFKKKNLYFSPTSLELKLTLIYECDDDNRVFVNMFCLLESEEYYATLLHLSCMVPYSSARLAYDSILGLSYMF